MILVDTSQLLIGAFSVQTKFNKDIDESLIRHLFLNNLRANRVKFKDKFGELVLCMDSTNHWRKDIFPHYKANRKKNRDSSGLDWKEIFRIFSVLQEELVDVFPYKFIKVSRAEADDVIATLVKHYPEEQKLILSSDKDFMQLQKFPNVKQYAPVSGKWLTEKNPALFLREHIIRGDSGDGVPNFLSADDVLITEGARQKSIMQKHLNVWLSLSEEEFHRNMTPEQREKYQRNELLIDLENIPQNISESILQSYRDEPRGKRGKIMDYFIKHKLGELLKCLPDF